MVTFLASWAGSPATGSHVGHELLCPTGAPSTSERRTWAGLTLAGCEPLAGLPGQILHVVQGDGPQGRLAA